MRILSSFGKWLATRKDSQQPQQVGGLITFYGLDEWWLSAFTEEERRSIQQRYRPFNLSAASLTAGTVVSSEERTDFLNALASHFRATADRSIAERIRQQLALVAKEHPLREPGAYRGRHFTTYVEEVKELKRAGRIDEAEALLLQLVEATEAEDKREKLGVAPWYYQQLAMIYRKRKDYVAEVGVLERFAKHRHGSGVLPSALIERLREAHQLVKKNA